MARLIAIEGIDGSGKGTQAARLVGNLTAAGHTAALHSFPRYDDTLFGQAIGEYLNGRFGSLQTVHPFLASLLYAGDRFESKQVLLDALATHDFLILDRYVASNMAHQASRLTGAERSELIERISTIEFEVFGLPRPDRVLLLDLPSDDAQQLILKKSQRTYTDKPADIHEEDAEYLAGVRQVYRELSETDATWRVVDCKTDDTLRSIDDIAADILQQTLAAVS